MPNSRPEKRVTAKPGKGQLETIMKKAWHEQE